MLLELGHMQRSLKSLPAVMRYVDLSQIAKVGEH
jgi:hypothetical protein